MGRGAGLRTGEEILETVVFQAEGELSARKDSLSFEIKSLCNEITILESACGEGLAFLLDAHSNGQDIGSLLASIRRCGRRCKTLLGSAKELADEFLKGFDDNEHRVRGERLYEMMQALQLKVGGSISFDKDGVPECK
jgi:hypothetical protein